MAQVEQYLTDHLHSSKERLRDDPSHPINSSVPSRPGPELDIKYHGLPEPPHYIPPQSHEERESLEPQNISINPLPLVIRLNPSIPSETEKTLDQDVTTEETIPHSTSEVQNLPVHDNTENAVSYPRSEVEKVFDHDDADETTLDPTSEVVKDSVPPPILESMDMPEESEPVHVNEPSPLPESTEEHFMEPEPANEVLDHQTTPQEELIEEATEAEEPKSIPEPVASRRSVSKSEPLTNEISHEEKTLKQEEEVIRPEPNGIKQSTTQSDSKVSTHDWTDLTRPEVQFALCLFAVPWTSILITSRTLNQICFMIFDWQLVQPVTGLLLSVLAPSMPLYKFNCSLYQYLDPIFNKCLKKVIMLKK
ncbi:hypothetical protein DFH28DRAFT_1150203 [Melampsora americana]|nr:hypothetical protein DFH28DRAFT_1150203 [Melampsora americana]